MNGMFLTSGCFGLSKRKRSSSAPQLRTSTDGESRMLDGISSDPERRRTFPRPFLFIIAAVLVLVLTAPERSAAEDPLTLAPDHPESVAPFAADFDEADEAFDIAELVDRNVIFGVPQSASEVEVLWNVGYTVGYSSETRTPLWVSYRLFADPEFQSIPRPTRFIADHRVENAAKHNDYNNSGYDRGHMAPNASIAKRYGEEAQRATFLTTNIVPQLPGLNQRGWEALEGVISEDWAERFTELWVFVGPLFEGPCWELESGVRIPSHCYMIVVDIDDDTNEIHALGIVMEQRRIEREPIEDFVVTLAEIEQRTGIDFLHELEDEIQSVLENSAPDSRWEIKQVLDPRFPGREREIRRNLCEK